MSINIRFKLEETSTQNCHDEISDREILDVAFDSYIKMDKTDVENEYCYMLTIRIVNYQILHDLAVSSPIFTSYRSFPQLEDIQKQYSILASDPHASSKLVKSLLAKNRTKILDFINKVINDCQTPENRDKIINVSIFLRLTSL